MVLSGCALLTGLDEFSILSTGEGGAGGSGGEGNGSSVNCTPGTEEVCYSGLESTDGVGLCRAGMRVCDDEGNGWGSCEGEVVPAVEQCDDDADEDCDGRHCIVWAKAFAQDGSFTPYGIASDDAGHVLVAGMFTGTLTAGEQTFAAAGSTDGLLLKLRSNGEPLWGKKIGDVDSDFLAAVTTDMDGNIFTAGRALSSIDLGDGTIAPGLFAAKLDPQGGTLWSTSMGGDGAFADVAVDAIGNLVAVGFFNEPIDHGSGPVAPVGGRDILIAKFDGETGSVSAADGGWVRTLGDASDQAANAVAIDPSNNIFVGGDFKGTLDIGGTNGQATAMGDEDDGFLAKLTPAGNGSWIFVTFADLAQHVNDVVVDSQGQPAIVGDYEGLIELGPYALTSQGGRDAFIIHLGAGKDVLWAGSFGGAGDQIARAAALDADDSILVGGYAEGELDLGGGALPVEGPYDGFIAKLSPAGMGAHLWSHRLGGAGAEGVASLAVSPSQETLTAAFSDAENPDFGTGPLGASAGSSSRLVIAKLGR